MQVALLTRKLDNRPTNGFERYAHNLCAGLKHEGVRVFLPNQAARLPVSPSGSLVSPPYYDVVLPALQLLQGRLDKPIIHALTDSQALPFPFLKGKKVVTMHHVDKIPPGSPSEAIFRRFYSVGTHLAVKHADHIICISEQTRSEVREVYDVPEDIITVIPQAIPMNMRPLSTPRSGRVVGYIGAFKRRKNLDALINAFSIACRSDPSLDLRLLLYGKGPDEARLRAKVISLGLSDQVEFLGVVPEDHIVEAYNSFDLLAFPSLQEGFGFPILEAHACGVPVLTLEDVMIPEEVTRHTMRGRGEEGMAENIVRVLTDPSLREGLISRGLDYAAGFTVASMAKRTIAVYEKVLY